MAQALWDGFFTPYGFPASILSDQGHNFDSTLINELCNLGGIHKICTSPYHLQGNGQCKHFNSTLISMIGTLQEEDESHHGPYLQLYEKQYN